MNRNYSDLKIYANTISVIILFSLILKLVILKYLKISFFTTNILICFISYLFQFGHIIIFSLGYKFTVSNFALELYDIEIYKNAINLSIYSLWAFFLGGILINKSINRDISKEFDMIEEKKIKILGYLFIILALPFNLYILIRRITQVRITNTYLSIHTNDVSYVIEFLANILYVGVFLLIYYYRKKKNIAKLILYLILVYSIINMFTGIRSYSALIIIFFIYIYINVVEKFRLKEILIWAVIGFFIIVLMGIIREIRKKGITLENILVGFNIIKNNILFRFFEEFGYTFNVNCEMIKLISHGANQPFGRIIYSDFLSIIPKVSDIIPWIDFGTMSVKELGIWNMGTSFIADSYYYFGKLAYIFMFIFGIYVAKIDNVFKSYINKNDGYKAGILVFGMLNLFNLIRSTLTFNFRYFVWGAIFMICLKKIIFKENFIKRSKK